MTDSHYYIFCQIVTGIALLMAVVAGGYSLWSRKKARGKKRAEELSDRIALLSSLLAFLSFAGGWYFAEQIQ